MSRGASRRLACLRAESSSRARARATSGRPRFPGSTYPTSSRRRRAALPGRPPQPDSPCHREPWCWRSASSYFASLCRRTQSTKKLTASTKAPDGKANPAAEDGQGVPPGGDVKMSGMSILGNEDAPKSLVLVPWKSSQLADMPSVSRLLDSSTQPVDKDVFMRELSYYEFKSGSK